MLGGLININDTLIFWLITSYFSVWGYLGLFQRNKSWIASNLIYMNSSLNVYGKEYFETTKDDKVVKEKYSVRLIDSHSKYGNK